MFLYSYSTIVLVFIEDIMFVFLTCTLTSLKPLMNEGIDTLFAKVHAGKMNQNGICKHVPRSLVKSQQQVRF